jgi:hypothetical protein
VLIILKKQREDSKMIKYVVVAIASLFNFGLPALAEEPVQFSVELANAYSVHAMMSSNAYVDKEDRVYFPLEELGWQKVDLSGNPVPSNRNSYTPTWIGRLFSNLQFDIWEHQSTLETIIAFKGTDENIDWLSGNLAVGISIPYKSAKKKVKKYVKNNPGRQVSLAGHSLGGGLALSVSVWEGLDAIVFNTSPRIFDGRNDMSTPAVRKAIFQEKEVLQKIRKFYPKFREKIPPGDIIQTSFKYGDGSNHRIDLLAEGILRCADSEPLVSMARKLDVKVECYL